MFINPLQKNQSIGSRLTVLGDKALPFVAWRVFPYGPGNPVYAPHPGQYDLTNLAQGGVIFSESQKAPEGNKLSDYDGIRIATTINGKKVVSWLFIMTFANSKQAPTGEITGADFELPEIIGQTINTVLGRQAKGLAADGSQGDGYSNLGWGMTIDGVQIDPWVAASEFGGLVYPEEWKASKEQNRKPDIASTASNESTSAPQQKDGGSDWIAWLAGLAVLRSVLKGGRKR